MQGNQVGFESSLQQHLDVEQRRAVLEAIGGSINPDSTLGEIIDAAEALGWSEKMGDLSLADLAEALLAPDGQSPGATLDAAAGESDDEGDADAESDAEDEDDDFADEDEGDDYEDEDEDDEDEDELLDEDDDEPEPAPARKGGRAASAKETKAAAASKKKAAAKPAPAPAKKASKKAVEPEPMRGAKKTAKKVAGKPGKKVAEAPAAKPARAAEKAAPAAAGGKKAGKKLVKRKLADVDVDDRMSLDQAAEFFLPYVEELGEATMQALEEQTGVSRRKLRFHVGQLVKHGYLERHGMGRGTYYTRC